MEIFPETRTLLQVFSISPLKYGKTLQGGAVKMRISRTAKMVLEKWNPLEWLLKFQLIFFVFAATIWNIQSGQWHDLGIQCLPFCCSLGDSKTMVLWSTHYLRCINVFSKGEWGRENLTKRRIPAWKPSSPKLVNMHSLDVQRIGNCSNVSWRVISKGPSFSHIFISHHFYGVGQWPRHSVIGPCDIPNLRHKASTTEKELKRLDFHPNGNGFHITRSQYGVITRSQIGVRVFGAERVGVGQVNFRGMSGKPVGAWR